MNDKELRVPADAAPQMREGPFDGAEQGFPCFADAYVY